MTSWRPPASKAEQDELTVTYARDGYALLEAVCDESSPAWLRELPAVDVLRRVLVQNYTPVTRADGREVIRRREKEAEMTASRPAMPGSPLPTTLTPGGASSGKSPGWGTSCTSPGPATCTSPEPATTSRDTAAPAMAGPASAATRTSPATLTWASRSATRPSPPGPGSPARPASAPSGSPSPRPPA
ncbi:MAG TPA: hypothetical protein VKV80_11870 [Streptosporangiaceae bacterium]|nr:hypothetical protein [Streptosporangiaceae bacterium]